jgi:hypothetical protein
MPIDIKALLRALNMCLSNVDVTINDSHAEVINKSFMFLGRMEVLEILARIEDGTLDIQKLLKQE